MGQSQVYTDLENIRGFIQLTKVTVMVTVLFPEFSMLITKNNGISQAYRAVIGSISVKTHM